MDYGDWVVGICGVVALLGTDGEVDQEDAIDGDGRTGLTVWTAERC